jgi:hypothetical protein
VFLGPTEGKDVSSVFENEDERIRGPLLPSFKSDSRERPVYDRDPRHPEGKYPAEGEVEVVNVSRHKREA